MNATTPRICPRCGATNTGRSLFCAECGASLNEPADPNLTRPFAPTADASNANESSQQTERYAPSWEQTWAGGEPTPTPIDTDAAPMLHPPGTPAATSHPVLAEPERTMRGFYLGVIAILIIIAVALALGWFTLVQPNL